MVTKKTIVRYWNCTLKGKIDVPFSEEQCFACGDTYIIERCHIIPRNSGGTDLVNNIHLLCKKCHIESEFLYGNVYWNWFNYQRKHEWKLPLAHTVNRYKKMGFDITQKMSELVELNLESKDAFKWWKCEIYKVFGDDEIMEKLLDHIESSF